MERFSMTVDARLMERFDQLLERKGYPSRSEGLRDLIRNAIVEDDWGAPDATAAATVTIVYNHHQSDLAERLDHLQHHHLELVVSKTHVHLDAENCLEVIILRGACEAVRSLAERLIAERGVKHGKVVFTTSGQGVW